MSNEEKIKQTLMEQFGFSPEQINIARQRRIFVEVAYEQFRQVFELAVRRLDFNQLCTITGLDEGETLAFLYHLARADGIVLTIKTCLPKAQPNLQTISDLFPGSINYERELEDLLGARVAGLPPGQRYPLPDDWPTGQYPLRKDWKPTEHTPAAAAKEEKNHG